MAVDAFICFQQYSGASSGGAFLSAEAQTDFSQNNEVLMKQPFVLPTKPGQGTVPSGGPAMFEIQDFNFDIEQTLNIGSSSSGAGAGKITFNPFSITRKIDKCSPIFFQMACSGTPFALVTLALRKSSGAGSGGAGNTSGQIYLRFDFKLVAVKTISWSYDDESPKEEIAFEYGALMVNYSPQNPDGSMLTPIAGGWNRVKNVQDTSTNLTMTNL